MSYQKMASMFEVDLASAKPIGTAKPDEIDELDVRLAYLEGFARAFDKFLPSRAVADEPFPSQNVKFSVEH